MPRIPRIAGLILFIGAAMSTGCATRGAVLLLNPHAGSETLTMSREDHRQSILDSAAHDRRALVEDLDLLFLTDRPTRLTQWHDR